MKRREFISIPANTLGGVLLYTLAKEPFRLHAQDAEIKVPLRFFTAAEAQTVAAACERILPGDESGPGAKEAGAVIYIDRQLAGPYGKDKYRYTKGPWLETVAEHGYQGRATPQEVYRAGIAKLGAGFASLSPAEQDAVLEANERTLFFAMLRTHTIEGMFCDPMHGGNAGMIGWQMIGFPGPLMSHREEIEKYRGIPYPERKPRSLEQMVGRKVVPWEDETV